DGRLTKPFDPSHLRSVLSDAISTRKGSESGTLPPPAPVPPPMNDKKGEPKFNPNFFQSEEKQTGEISLSDPIWAETPSTKPPVSPPHDDSDIKHLTESTVKMSGLDEFSDWDISEA